MDPHRCAQRQAAIAALSDYFQQTSLRLSRLGTVATGGSKVESLRCQIEAHAERLAIVAELAGQGRAALADVEHILSDLRELGVFADNRLLSGIYKLYSGQDAQRAA
jgi:hypothetical protein